MTKAQGTRCLGTMNYVTNKGSICVQFSKTDPDPEAPYLFIIKIAVNFSFRPTKLE